MNDLVSLYKKEHECKEDLNDLNCKIEEVTEKLRTEKAAKTATLENTQLAIREARGRIILKIMEDLLLLVPGHSSSECDDASPDNERHCSRCALLLAKEHKWWDPENGISIKVEWD